MSDVLFYHLERTTLESALPQLLHKCLERGWRAVVQAGSSARVEALDASLWSHDDASFLPHGARRDGFEAEQPVWLTTDGDNPNSAQVRFYVDRAPVGDPTPYERIIILFDDQDREAVSEARALWKRLRDEGHAITYWKQDDRGRWEKKG